MSTSQPDASGGSAGAAWDLNACDELSANIPGSDSALQSRMQTLLQQASGRPRPYRCASLMRVCRV